jgi:cell division transport system permease protein
MAYYHQIIKDMLNYLLNQKESFAVAVRRLVYSKSATSMMFIVIGITMCLPVLAFLFLENIKQASSQIEYKAEISIFLKTKYSEDGLKELNIFLKEQPIVNKIVFEKRDDSWQKLQKKLNINGSDLIDNNPLPDSLYLSLNTLDEKEIDFFIKESKNFEIIDEITVDSAWINKLNSILSLSQLIVNFIGFLLLVVLSVIIGNTIRLQTLSYKDEIEVSKLIGASNSFIRRPFLYTGSFYGLGGGLVTVGLIKSLIYIFNLNSMAIEKTLGFNISLLDLRFNHYFFTIMICVAIGWLSSFFASTRSLNKIKNNA